MNLAFGLGGIFVAGLLLLFCAIWRKDEARKVGQRFNARPAAPPPDD